MRLACRVQQTHHKQLQNGVSIQQASCCDSDADPKQKFWIKDATLPNPNQAPCSAELISTAYQPWNSVFLSHQNSHNRLISRRNSLPNMVII
jgi:hypothetical protein